MTKDELKQLKEILEFVEVIYSYNVILIKKIRKLYNNENT